MNFLSAAAQIHVTSSKLRAKCVIADSHYTISQHIKLVNLT